MESYNEAFCQDVFHITRKAIEMENEGLIIIDDRNGLFFSVMAWSKEFYKHHDPAIYDKEDYTEDIDQFAEKKLLEDLGIGLNQSDIPELSL